MKKKLNAFWSRKGHISLWYILKSLIQVHQPHTAIEISILF